LLFCLSHLVFWLLPDGLNRIARKPNGLNRIARKPDGLNRIARKADGMNILGLVVFSIFFGCTLSKMGKTGKPLADFFECMHLATMKLVTLVHLPGNDQTHNLPHLGRIAGGLQF
jgi:hypothetical protein